MEINKIHQGDCLELMKQIEDKSIDMVLCDLPYGITACKWDSIIDLKKLWKQYERIIKSNRAIVLTSQQPFTTTLISFKKELFKYQLIWDKNSSSGGFLNVKKKPIQVHEEILIFSKAGCTTGSKPLMLYNPIMEKRDKPRKSIAYNNPNHAHPKMRNLGGKKKIITILTHKYPKSIIRISNADKRNILHPTQKPVELFKYLIKTYTNEGDLVLDNCIGLGTTAVACKQLRRNFIGIEIEKKYVDLANKRLQQEVLMLKSTRKIK